MSRKSTRSGSRFTPRRTAAPSMYVKTSARVQLTTVIEMLRDKYKDEKFTLVVTGNSLGGALATQSAFDFVENKVVDHNVMQQPTTHRPNNHDLMPKLKISKLNLRNISLVGRMILGH
ncbi:Fungal lipase-like domain containing protein [Parasponia andersonii]|uniref:Phospholipase A1 n=1 Tax=Parasponia andersonii TaxID=3476 RepID=A0A2P5ASV4_PARAD|nr:Fungal lipase-like domain containing protein [Parasponia andersonii]